jgi:hypothetical protein
VLTSVRLGVFALTWREPGEKGSFTSIVNLEHRFGEMLLPAAIKGKELLTGHLIDMPGGPYAGPVAIPQEPLIIEVKRKIVGLSQGVITGFSKPFILDSWNELVFV